METAFPPSMTTGQHSTVVISTNKPNEDLMLLHLCGCNLKYHCNETINSTEYGDLTSTLLRVATSYWVSCWFAASCSFEKEGRYNNTFPSLQMATL